MTAGIDPAGAIPAGGSHPESNRPRLIVEDLRVSIKDTDVDVVDEVKFTVRAGELLGLVGESGSGKTTVALALLGYARRGLVIAHGAVRLDDLDILHLTEHELRRVRGSKVAYVPQDPRAALNPALTIGYQVREAIRIHAEGHVDVEERLRAILTDVGLDSGKEFAHRYPHQLSGGQQQRVTIAMAFAAKPALIVLDEPTTGLDVSTQRQVLATVQDLCRKHGVAGVYVTHDLAAAGELVSSVCVMYAGRQVEVGPVLQVFTAPQHPYTRGLLAAIPNLDRAERLLGIEGQPPRPGARGTGCTFAPRCPEAEDRCFAHAPPVLKIQGSAVRCWHADRFRPWGPGADRQLPAIDVNDSAALAVSTLRASYGELPVLSDVSFELARETCLAVVGESGSGKTTLAQCIVGLHHSWSGDVEFAGSALARSAAERSVDELRRMQYVFQNPYASLNPRKTVGQIIAQPLEHFVGRDPEQRDRIVRSLLDVALDPDLIERFPDQLSGGERQRVAIARALVVEPELLICDEVTSSLDVSAQAVIVELLRRLQRKRQLSMIFITHNLALVRSIAQSVVVLKDGRVVESGPVESIIERPAEVYTRQLMSDAPRLIGSQPAGGGVGSD
jgi:peptide/nickel transport system ATP-binding protein